MMTIPSNLTFQAIISPDWVDYELLDSGEGAKLEKIGPYTIIRPEAEAIWQRSLPESSWKKAHAVFKPGAEEMGGHWERHAEIPPRWKIRYKNISFWVQLSASRHIGFFPEQASQWDWMADLISRSNRQLHILNLFGYTGLSTLMAASVGAHVTHVDASKKAITWAKENLTISGLQEKPVRWILDDALKFIQREARRGVRYDGLILDPPKFGRGPKGEVWEFYKLLPNLLDNCRQVLSTHPIFVIITAYAVKASSITLSNAVAEMMSKFGGNISFGELVLKEKSASRQLSTAVFAQWSS